MEQPRFGGVALLPLSTTSGEGTSPESAVHTMESTGMLDYCPVQEKLCEESPCSSQDADIRDLIEALGQVGVSSKFEQYKPKHERKREPESMPDSGVYCKNLLLKDKKGQAYLLVFEEDQVADLHVVKYHINAHGNLHFASRQTLWDSLRVRPGSVSPLALIHSAGDIRVFIDASLVKRIDKDVTKLYFHPLRVELQVGLTLSQLEEFLHRCQTTIEVLPSLTSYAAARRYGNLTGGHHKKHKDQNDACQSQFKVQRSEDMQETVSQHETVSVQESKLLDETVEAENTITTHAEFFQKLGITVKVIRAEITEDASQFSALPCKCVYLKDKRDNYFLFICHELQKIDFSNLKTQLKPRKKITPLDDEELKSLLNLREGKEHPFSLADLTQPRFLVAIADNLHTTGHSSLTFPHPTDSRLRLEVQLQHLETFINNTSHDLTTIQVKGNIEDLQALAMNSLLTNQPNNLDQKSNPSNKEMNPLALTDNKQSVIAHHSAIPHFARSSTNVFISFTAYVRHWVLITIRRLVQLLHRHLPHQLSIRMQYFPVWERMLTSGNTSEDNSGHDEETTNMTAEREKEKTAKVEKLKQLIKQSGIEVVLMEIQPQAQFLENAEKCKTFLLECDHHHIYFVLSTEEDDPTQHNLRRLRTAFRTRRSLQFSSERGIAYHLSWADGSGEISWTPEDLNPMALLDLDLQTLGRVRVGLRGAMYSFPGTVLHFELPPLGVSLQMTCDDLEKMLKRLGFCVVYLP